MNGKKKFDRNKVQELIDRKDWKGLREYDFRGADLSRMYFWQAELDSMDFSGVDLYCVTFSGTTLKNANFRNASLRCVDLCSSIIGGADFRGADIARVEFPDMYMDGVIMDETTSHFHTHCPEEGGFTGYKKACTLTEHPYIVELKIPAHALRSSATTNKCRCSEAEVMSVTRLDGTDDGTDIVRSWWNPYFLYKAGETVKADGFDENRWNECAPGIHFFMTREEAVDYVF